MRYKKENWGNNEANDLGLTVDWRSSKCKVTLTESARVDKQDTRVLRCPSVA